MSNSSPYDAPEGCASVGPPERTDEHCQFAPAWSGEDDSMLECILHNRSVCIQVQCVHQPVFVERDGSCGEVEHGRNLLHRLAFGEQLQDLDLPLGQRELHVGGGYRLGLRKQLGGLGEPLR